MVVNGRAVVGANAIAGEWGHKSLPWPEGGRAGRVRPCYCGRTGCIETFLSGPGMARDHQRETGEAIDAHTVAARAGTGDAGAAATLERYQHRLARALASIINVLDPDVIVVGGGLSNIDQLLTRVPEIWPEYVFSDHVATRLLKAMCR